MSTPSRLRLRASGAVVGIPVALSLAAAGCGGGGDGGSAAAGSHPVSVTLTDDGCAPDPSSVPAGPVTFTIRNKDSSSASEVELLDGSRILGEKENLTPGLSGSFSLKLAAGKYTVSCPGAKASSASFTVTGAKDSKDAKGSGGNGNGNAASADLDRATAGYATYVKGQSDQLVTATKAFAAAVRAGDVARARALYGPARVFYERIEPVAESFGDLDPAIDARANDVPDTSKWTGFHRIEQALYQKNTTAGMATFATKLVADVTKLDGLVATARYQPAQLANGASELLDEVAKSKITGEEERYSHIDLVDFVANVDGAHEAFTELEPALKAIDPTLDGRIARAFTTLNATLARYHHGDGPADYVGYRSLSHDDITTLAGQVDALAEPLSQVGARIVTGK